MTISSLEFKIEYPIQTTFQTSLPSKDDGKGIRSN